MTKSQNYKSVKKGLYEKKDKLVYSKVEDQYENKKQIDNYYSQKDHCETFQAMTQGCEINKWRHIANENKMKLTKYKKATHKAA